MEKVKLISTVELKRLLITIIDYKLPISFRFRLLGEMWYPNFMKIIKTTDEGVLLNDETKNKFVLITELSHIVQFEIDGRIHTFEPNFHYDLSPAGSV